MTKSAEDLKLRMRFALVASVLLLMLRLQLAKVLGFADAEALYACYALHPQPAYLDQPGLVGLVMHLIARGNAAPDPRAAHLVAAVLATALPWLGALAARAASADAAGCLRTALVLAFAPEIAIGLFALTPDLLLALLWVGSLGAFAFALRAPPASTRALYAMLAAGALLGFAMLAKVSAILLGLAFAVTLAQQSARAHLKTVAPWAALLLSSILVSPLIVWEVQRGYPMFTHRLIATQQDAGFSLRNLAALVGGQLLYLSPPLLIGAALVARQAFQRRRTDAVSQLLWHSTWIPGLLLAILCAWSRVAEPHWLAPAYLALALELGRSNPVPRGLGIASLVTGAVLCAVAFVWVGTPLPTRLLGTHYRPRYDLANDLYAWGPGRHLIIEAAQEAMRDSQRLPVVVGPYYTVCAQAHAALGAAIPVGCNTPIRDDFDDWYPRSKWLDAPVVLYVEDDRFQTQADIELPNRIVRAVSTASVRRGDVVVRTLRVIRLDKLSDTARNAH